MSDAVDNAPVLDEAPPTHQLARVVTEDRFAGRFVWVELGPPVTESRREVTPGGQEIIGSDQTVDGHRTNLIAANGTPVVFEARYLELVPVFGSPPPTPLSLWVQRRSDPEEMN